MSFFKIKKFCSERFESYKVKQFACKSLSGTGGRSGLRLIYIYDTLKNTIHFVEIYFKGDKENEDKERLKKAFEDLNKKEP